MLIRRLKIKIFHPPDNKSYKLLIINAGSGKYFHAVGIENELMRIADSIESSFPEFEYRMVPTGTDSFNFIFTGIKQKVEAVEAVNSEIENNNQKGDLQQCPPQQLTEQQRLALLKVT